MYKKVVIKIGTNVITRDDGMLDEKIIEKIAHELSALISQKIEVILVSSGAMGAGRGIIKIDEKTDKIVRRQILSSVGQIKLMETYSRFFQKQNQTCAQILATKEDFRDRHHYLNMRSCLSALLKEKVIPIINENDAVSIDELMFTDNDELAGLISAMLNADALIILTSVDGIFNKDPNDKTAKVISKIHPGEKHFISSITNTKSLFGRGGMSTKTGIAEKMASLGIVTHIINGKDPSNIQKLLNNTEIGTTFLPRKKSSNIKKWLAYNEDQKAAVHINEGAATSITTPNKAISLLPVGITKISGEFKKGDIISIIDPTGQKIALGRASYSSTTANKHLGQKNQKPLIHYNYLLLV